MTATQRHPTASDFEDDPLRLPDFRWGSSVGWAITRLIHATLGGLRLPDGTGSRWTRFVAPALTISRGGFPLYGGMFTWYAVHGQTAQAAIWFGVIALAYFTDAVDGAWARYWHCTTRSGGILDPIMDKVAEATMLICWGFLLWTYVPGWPFEVFVVLATIRALEDLTLALIAFMELRHTRKSADGPKAGPWGKFKSGADVASVILACIGGLFYSADGPGWLFMVPAFACLLLAIGLAPLSIREHWRKLKG